MKPNNRPQSPYFATVLTSAEQLIQNSTAEEANSFDTARWLEEWLDLPQPALCGQTPSELLDAPTGVETVLRILGSIESGSYQ